MDSLSGQRPTQRVAVIAAAGRGSRFDHEIPKVLADVQGTPCLRRVLDAVEEGLGEHLQLVIVGHNAEQVRSTIGEAPHRRYVHQRELRGTGDALLCGLAAIDAATAGDCYFFCGDKPMLRGSTVTEFRRRFEATGAPMLFLTGQIEGDEKAVLANRQGRVVQVPVDGRPHALGIVERSAIEALAADQSFRLSNGVEHRFGRDDLLRMREVNVSTYAWSLPHLRRVVGELSDDNPQGEVLVTDLVQIFLAHGYPVETMPLSDPVEGKGIDTVAQWEELR